MDLKNKICLVTGGAKRIGRAIALEFARRGARVLIHYNTSETEARLAAEECAKASGLSGGIYQADLSDLASIDRMMQGIFREHGSVDVLVNNASRFRSAALDDLSAEEWDRTLNINLRAPVWLARAVAPGMREKGQGAIINIADASANTPWPGFLPYCVSKAGLISLTKGLARELAPIRVNAISPGAVLLPEGASKSLQKRCAESNVLGRLGTPEDIAQTAAFLVEGPEFITGAVIEVDGGSGVIGGMREAK